MSHGGSTNDKAGSTEKPDLFTSFKMSAVGAEGANPYSSPALPTAFGTAFDDSSFDFSRQDQLLRNYRVYCRCMGLLYSAITVGALVFSLLMFDSAESEAERYKHEASAIAMLVMCPPLAALFFTGAVARRSRFAYILGYVTIILGLQSLCTAIFCIFFLIGWVKPEMKAYMQGDPATGAN